MSASRLLYGDDEQDDDASGLGSCLPAAEQLVRMSVKYFGGGSRLRSARSRALFAVTARA
eukprot:690953-Pelagomonas_calceolata.AAC.17